MGRTFRKILLVCAMLGAFFAMYAVSYAGAEYTVELRSESEWFKSDGYFTTSEGYKTGDLSQSIIAVVNNESEDEFTNLEVCIEGKDANVFFISEELEKTKLAIKGSIYSHLWFYVKPIEGLKAGIYEAELVVKSDQIPEGVRTSINFEVKNVRVRIEDVEIVGKTGTPLEGEIVLDLENAEFDERKIRKLDGALGFCVPNSGFYLTDDKGKEIYGGTNDLETRIKSIQANRLTLSVSGIPEQAIYMEKKDQHKARINFGHSPHFLIKESEQRFGEKERLYGTPNPNATIEITGETWSPKPILEKIIAKEGESEIKLIYDKNLDESKIPDLEGFAIYPSDLHEGYIIHPQRIEISGNVVSLILEKKIVVGKGKGEWDKEFIIYYSANETPKNKRITGKAYNEAAHGIRGYYKLILTGNKKDPIQEIPKRQDEVEKASEQLSNQGISFKNEAARVLATGIADQAQASAVDTLMDNVPVTAKKAAIKALTDSTKNILAQNGLYKFKDVSVNAWYSKDLAVVTSLGLIKGTGKTTISPQKTVTGQEMMTMLVRSMGKEAAAASGGSWFEPYKKEMVALKLNEGLNINLEKGLTRAEVAAIMYQYVKVNEGSAVNLDKSVLSGVKDVNSIPTEYKEAVAYMYQKGLLKGYENGNFAPNNKVSRVEVASILARLLAM